MKKDIGLKILLLLFLAAPLFSQPYEIHGRVMDRETKEPLVGAEVTLFATQPADPSDTGICRAITNNDGYFTIRRIPHNDLIAKITFINSYPLMKRIAVDDSSSINCYLDFKPTRMEWGRTTRPLITKETNARQQVVQEEIMNSAGRR